MNKVELSLIGITYNQIESGVYALILEETHGTRRIPIIVGYPEAQSVECHLHSIKTQRPLSHDTMVRIFDEFQLKLKEVFIRRLPNGVFAADLIIEGPFETKQLDSRSSDAIALAIRTGAPIYTSEEVLNEAGFEPRNESRPLIGESKIPRRPNKKHPVSKEKKNSESDLSELSLEALRKAMEEAAENEDYEKAARIKNEISGRKSSNPEM